MYTTAATYGTEQDRMIFGEKSDHLGNVRAVVSDVRKPVDITGDIDDWTWQADITDHFSYYPFGMLEPGRQKQLNTVNAGGYRFGFGGHEKDDEVNGITGSHYTTQARPYDSRLGRWWSIDPKFRLQPGWSPYKGFLDNPILYQDPAGETEYTTTIITDERTGETTKITVPTADRLMTDGKQHYKDGMGDTWTYENYYYDYEIINTVIIDKDGNKSETTSTRIMYENNSQDEDFVWFGGNDAGDTKYDWSLDQSGGIHFTWSLGQGQETRTATFDVETVNIDDLMAVIGAGKRAAGSKNPGNLAEPLNHLLGMIETGMDLTDAVQKTIEGIKDMSSNKGNPVGVTCKNSCCEGDTIPWDKRNEGHNVKDTIYEKK